MKIKAKRVRYDSTNVLSADIVQSQFLRSAAFSPDIYVNSCDKVPAAKLNSELYGKKPELVSHPDPGEKGFVKNASSLIDVCKASNPYDGLKSKIINSSLANLAETYDDFLCADLLTNDRFLSEAGRIFGNDMLRIERNAKNVLSYDPASLSELKKRGVLLGGGVYRGAYVEDPLVHRRNKPAIDSSLLKEVLDGVCEWAMKIVESARIVFDKNTNCPRLTSNGSLLALRRDGQHWRTFAKSLLGLLGYKTNTFDQFKEVADTFNSVMTAGGYSPLYNSYVSGRRRMHYNGLEPVVDFSITDINDLVVARYTRNVQERIRNIFMQNEHNKCYEKPFADMAKKIIMINGGIANTEPEFVSKLQMQIAHFCKANDLITEEGEWLCFYDISNQDNSICWQLQEVFYSILERVCGLPQDYKWFKKASTAVFPLTASPASSIYELNLDGEGTPSGESLVTVKNCFIHLCLFLYCCLRLKLTSKLTPEFINSLSDPNSSINFHCLGDDGMLKLGRSQVLYLDYQRILKQELGVTISFESGSNFLKRNCSRRDGRIIAPHTIPGSAMRGLTGEYAKRDEVIFKCGLCDRVLMLNEVFNEALPEIYHFLMRRYGIPDDMHRLTEYRLELNPQLMELAKSSGAKAKSVQSYLEHIWYVQGENLFDDDMIKIYGELRREISNDDSGLGLAELDFKTLLMLAEKAQQFVQSNADATPNKEVIASLVRDWRQAA